MYDFDKIENTHQGETAFVIGGGWSLDEMPINDIIKKGVSIACNNAIQSVDECHYFFMTDGMIRKFEYYNEVPNKAKTTVFCNDAFLNDYNESTHNKILLSRRENARWNWVCDNKDKKILMGYNVIHCAIHFAFVLGCSRVVLLGCDGNYQHGKKYASGDSHLLKDGTTYDAFADKIQSNNSDNHLSSSNGGHKEIKRWNPKKQILNASQGYGVTAYKRIKHTEL